MFSVCILPLITAFILSDLRKPILSPQNRHFFFFFFFFDQASVPSWLASALLRGTSCETRCVLSLTYAHRIPSACRVMPTFFTSRFCPILPSCKNMKANGRKVTYAWLSYTFYVSKLGYIRTCVYMQPLKCGNLDVFACHIENRAYGFLAGLWLQRAVSPLCLLGKFGLIVRGASDEAKMSKTAAVITLPYLWNL